jgi:hypothetical protein
MSRALKTILLLLCSFSAISSAACDSQLVNNVWKNLSHSRKLEQPSDYIACKTHPSLAEQVIVAIATKQQDTKELTGDDQDYNFVVALANRTTGHILAKYNGTIMNGGGPDLNGIEIDTAKYFVNPSTRAFGVRAHYSMREAFTSNDSLSLFIVNGKTISKILADFDVNINFYTPSIPAPYLNKSRSSTRTLYIGSTLHNGFYDLMVTEKIIDHDFIEGENDRKLDKLYNEQKKTYKLPFTGVKYDIPSVLRDFDCRIC